MDSYFYLFTRLLSAFFLCQDVNKTRSNCAIIGSNLSKKHKLTLYKTQNGESNYVDNKFFFNFLGDRHANTIELVSWLVHVLCDFKATWHQEAYFSVSRIHHGSTSFWCLYFTFLVKVHPPPFQHSLGSYLYLFFVIHF